MTLRETYVRLWTANTLDEEIWSSDAAFIPFDGADILHGQRAIVDHLLRRRASMTLLRDEFEPLTFWTSGAGSAAAVGRQRILTRSIGRAPQARVQTWFAAAVASVDGPRLKLVSEASPAVMIDVIAQYENHASAAHRT